jgi:hypothetical protein
MLRKVLMISFVLSVFLSCATKQTNTINKKYDIAYFKALVVKENSNFYKKDSTLWSNNFWPSEALYWVCVEDNITLRAQGWKSLAPFVGGWMKENAMPLADSILSKESFDNLSLQLADSLAFVTCTKKTAASGKEKIFMEQRVFQLKDTTWKIISMVSTPAYDTKGSTTNVFMHTGQ